MTDTSPEALDAMMEGVRAAVERLANTPMQMSVVEWQGVSSQLLAARELVPALAAEVRALREERDALKVTYDDLYGDALTDAKSDALEFEGDLWKEVRAYLDQLSFDWCGIGDGVTASEALQYIRDAMDGETARAKAAEATIAALEKRVKVLEGALKALADEYADPANESEGPAYRAAHAALSGDTP